MVIKEEGFGLRIAVYRLQKRFIAGNLSLTLLPKWVVPAWELCSPETQGAPAGTNPSAVNSHSPRAAGAWDLGQLQVEEGVGSLVMR